MAALPAVAGIDVSRLRYDLKAVTDGGTASIATALANFTYEEQPGELAMRVTANLYNDDTPLGFVHDVLRLGGIVVPLYDVGAGWVPIIDRAHIFTRGLNTTSGYPLVKMVAYDPLIHLQKSEFEKLYLEGASGRNMLLDLFQIWGLPVGRVDGPNVPMPKMALRGNLGSTVGDILKTAWLRGDEEYIVRWRDGAVEVIQAGSNETIYWLSGARNTPGADSEEDIHDLVTEVHIVGEQSVALADDAGPGANMKPRLERLLQSELYPAYGRLRAVVKSQAADTEDSILQQASTILSERGEPRRTQSVPAPDVPMIRKGDIVRITAGVLDGYYPVSGVVRDTDSRIMTLTIDNSGTLKRRVRQVKASRKGLIKDDPL